MKCKICNLNEIKKIKKIKSPINQQLYTFHKCHHCKSFFFDLNEHKHDLKELYDAADSDLFDVPFKRSLYWKKQIDIIKHINKDIKSVLDIGCRTGDFLMHWNNEINREGIELSEQHAAVAKTRGLTIHEDYVENIGFKEKKFDVVTCFAVLEHLDSPTQVLESLTKLTNDDGVLLIMVPYFDSYKAKFLYWINYRWHMFVPPMHLNFYSKSFLDSYMKEKGFVLKKARYTSGGMFNPFKKIPFIGRIFGLAMGAIDYYTPLNKIPLFDHMYLYYQKK